MAGVDETALEQLQHVFRQVQQAQAVGQRTAALAQLPGGLLLGQVAAGHQLTDAHGLFHRVQVFALQVLHQRDLHGLLVGDVLHDDRRFGQACHPAGPPAALACHDEIAAGHLGPHRDGLDEAMLGDAGGQLGQCLVIKGLAGLVGVRLDLPQRQGLDLCIVGLKAGRNVLEQTFQPSAEAPSFLCHLLILPPALLLPAHFSVRRVHCCPCRAV